jgi:hypothetical protein
LGSIDSRWFREGVGRVPGAKGSIPRRFLDFVLLTAGPIFGHYSQPVGPGGGGKGSLGSRKSSKNQPLPLGPIGLLWKSAHAFLLPFMELVRSVMNPCALNFKV